MYAKGVYEYTTVMAMKRALHLVEELGCGKVSSTQLEVSTGNSIEPKEMKVSVKRVNGVLGIEVPEEDMLRILSALRSHRPSTGMNLPCRFRHTARIWIPTRMWRRK